MCSIFGFKNFNHPPSVFGKMDHINSLLSHRGPDARGNWLSEDDGLYLAHNRLSIIDLASEANQPMADAYGNVIIFNGEIYNYKSLRNNELNDYAFKTHSDTEVILGLYKKFGIDCLTHLRGMFAFAIWDAAEKRLFCARDRFGIKPFYFTHSNDHFSFASEMKALLPLLPDIKTDTAALGEYLTFQYTLGQETLFKDIYQLMPGHYLTLKDTKIDVKKYWDVSYQINYGKPASFFEEKLRHLIEESVSYHLISDVPVGSYLSGGIDSSLIGTLAAKQSEEFYGSFHGRFTDYAGYDESAYAEEAAKFAGNALYTTTIQSYDFTENIQNIIYHLDTPVAGPGSFPQYMVSKLASEHVKVIMGGQGGDEIFGGYARYVIAYFEQTIKAAIDGTYRDGNFVVTPESILPNLTLLQEYKPLIRQFWKEGLFGPLDERYFRLIDRSVDTKNEIEWSTFDKTALFERFQSIFNNSDNVGKSAYFDKMTHFDFKCLLPALLHVEDRMSMAHGLESRVPLLDHSLVEFAATIPADVKFPGGKMKALLKNVFQTDMPDNILNRRDKMGFPVPLKEWFEGPLRTFVYDIFSSQAAKTRGFYDPQAVLANLNQSPQFSRKIWGLLSLELWYLQFHDQAATYKKILK